MNDFTKYPIRGLKIIRKSFKKQGKSVKLLNEIIASKQKESRQMFPPNYINRAQHRRNLSLK